MQILKWQAMKDQILALHPPETRKLDHFYVHFGLETKQKMEQELLEKGRHPIVSSCNRIYNQHINLMKKNLHSLNFIMFVSLCV